MKKKLSVIDLKKHCSEHAPEKIVFWTENQHWNAKPSPCKMQLSFKIMLIFEEPYMIILKSDDNLMCISHIKQCAIDTKASVLGTVLEIKCIDSLSPHRYITYTLILE